MRPRYYLAIVFALLISSSINVHATQKRALSEHDLLELLAGGVYNGRIAQVVKDRGITFVATAHDLASLRRAGADLALLNAVESARHVTAQLPERLSNPQGEQHVVPLTVPSPVESIPHNIRTIRPATSIVPQSAAPAPKTGMTKALPPALPVAEIPLGTTITVANWQRYSQYMPFGMAELFKGHYFWRMPLDLEIVVGPTIREKLPVGYTEATARYSRNVRVVHLANGHNDILNYSGGEPFPNPHDPDKGYKLLADLWYAYVPHFLAGTSRNP